MAFQSQKSIENFKSALANGGVRPTMFSVEITFPRAVVEASDDLNEKTLFLVKASQMPGSQVGVVEVPFRGRKLKVSGNRTFADWETTITNDGDFSLRKAMEKWSEIIQNHNFALGALALDTGDQVATNSRRSSNEDTGYFGTAVVRQLDRQGNQLRIYEFNGIWPSSIEPINLDFDATDTIEEYNVTFCVQYWHAGGPNKEGGDLGGLPSDSSSTFVKDSGLIVS